MSGFECFLADMGPRPSRLHSIDRVKNDGDYEPGNCRWATKVEQGRNRRSNRILIFHGKPITMTEATLVAFVSADAISRRLHKGWTVEAAVTTLPANRGRKKVQLPACEMKYRFSDDSIRGFVANRWTPDVDRRGLWQEAHRRFGADRAYVHKLCQEFGERRQLVSARAAILRFIAQRCPPSSSTINKESSRDRR